MSPFLALINIQMLFGVPPFGTRVLTGSECADDSARRKQLNLILFGELKVGALRRNSPQS